MRPGLYFIIFQCVSSAAFAQTDIWQRDDSVINPSGLDLNNSVNWIWCDINNDNDPDVLLYKEFTDGTKQSVLYCGRDSGPYYWQENNSFLNDFPQQSLNRIIAAKDMDENGFKDILTYEMQNDLNHIPCYLFLKWSNNINNTWKVDTLFSLQVPENFEYETPQIVDIDGDQDQDIIFFNNISTDKDSLLLVENIGSTEEPVFQLDSSAFSNFGQNLLYWQTSTPKFLDINNDNIMDLLFISEFEGICVCCYLGVVDTEGYHLNPDVLYLQIETKESIKLLDALDMNNDGHLDLLVCDEENRGFIFLNDPDSLLNYNFYQLGPIKANYYTSISPCLDENETITLLTTATNYSSIPGPTGSIYQYQQKPIHNKKLWQLVSRTPQKPLYWNYIYYMASFSDMDCNDKTELTFSLENDFITFETDNIHDYSTWTEKPDLLQQFKTNKRDSVYTFVRFADMDNDNKDDLFLEKRIFSGDNSTILSKTETYFYQNCFHIQPNLWEEKPEWKIGIDSVYYSSTFYDFDADGDMDLISGTHDGRIKYFENIGGKTSPMWRQDTTAFNSINVKSDAMPVLFDYDGDNRPDIFIGDGEGNIYYYNNQSESSVHIKNNQIPVQLDIFPNYPNPFNPTTTITWELSSPGQVTIKIYDITGRLVKILLHAQLNTGLHNKIWDATDSKDNSVAAGIYIYKIEFTGIDNQKFTQCKKMSFVK